MRLLIFPLAFFVSLIIAVGLLGSMAFASDPMAINEVRAGLLLSGDSW
jgi:hypothetical protein